MKLATIKSGNDVVPGVITDDRLLSIHETFADLTDVMELALTEEGRAEIALAVDGTTHPEAMKANDAMKNELR